MPTVWPLLEFGSVAAASAFHTLPPTADAGDIWCYRIVASADDGPDVEGILLLPPSTATTTIKKTYAPTPRCNPPWKTTQLFHHRTLAHRRLPVLTRRVRDPPTELSRIHRVRPFVPRSSAKEYREGGCGQRGGSHPCRGIDLTAEEAGTLCGGGSFYCV